MYSITEAFILNSWTYFSLQNYCTSFAPFMRLEEHVKQRYKMVKFYSDCKNWNLIIRWLWLLYANIQHKWTETIHSIGHVVASLQLLFGVGSIERGWKAIRMIVFKFSNFSRSATLQPSLFVCLQRTAIYCLTIDKTGSMRAHLLD